MHFVVMCDDKAFIAADKSVAHKEILRATITFFWEVRGVTS